MDGEKLLEKMGFSEKAREYIRKDWNVGILENPSVVVEYQGECGDIIEIYLRIEKNRRTEEDTITDASYQLTGCTGLKAAGSLLTEMVKGMPLEDAEKITGEDIYGDIPEKKYDCAGIAVNALYKAIKMYTAKEK